MKKIYYCMILVCVLFSCKNSKDTPNVEHISVNLNIIRFDRDVFSDAGSDVLLQKYGSFFNNFCEYIIGAGTPSDTAFENHFNLFRTDSIVLVAQNKAARLLEKYGTTLENELTHAFKLYKYYFQEKEIPAIYIYTSGFNHSLIIDENIIGIGVDKFLGSEEETYKQLGFSQYLVQNMRPELMASSAIGALAVDQFPLDNPHYSLIEKMIYEGKNLYFKEKLCPQLSENDLMGFTPSSMEFCTNNEKQMWMHIVENKLLYSDNYTIITKFTEDAPFTYDFSQDSPGKAANWLGLMIVRQYVDQTGTSLAALMTETDFEKILRESKYNPE